MADMPLKYGNVGNAVNVQPVVPSIKGAPAGDLIPRAPFVPEEAYVTPEVPEEASIWESAKASFQINTFTGQLFTAFDQEEYETDLNLDKKKFIKELSVSIGTVPNDEEIEFLMKGVNKDDMLNRWQLLKDKEEKQRIAADHPVAAFGAAMLDPTDIAIGVLTGGLGKAASAGRIASKLSRAGVGATVGGAAAGALSMAIAEDVPLSDTDIALNVVAGAIGGAVDFRPWGKARTAALETPVGGTSPLDAPTVRPLREIPPVPPVAPVRAILKEPVAPTKPVPPTAPDVPVPTKPVSPASTKPDIKDYDLPHKNVDLENLDPEAALEYEFNIRKYEEDVAAYNADLKEYRQASARYITEQKKYNAAVESEDIKFKEYTAQYEADLKAFEIADRKYKMASIKFKQTQAVTTSYDNSLKDFGQAQEQYLKEVDAYSAKLEANPDLIEAPPVPPTAPNFPEMPEMKDIEPSPMVATSAQRFKAVAPEELKALQSFHDAVSALGVKGKALANLILANPIDNKGLSATTVQRNFMLDGEKRLMPLERALKELGLYDKSRKAGGNAAVRIKRRALLKEVQDWMHRARRAELAANPEPNLGLKAQDQIDLDSIELPPEYKSLTDRGDVQWFHGQDDAGNTLLHGYDSKTEEIFRLYEVPDSADEHLGKAGTTKVGAKKPKREAWVLTAQGKWAPKKEVLRNMYRMEADPTYQAKYTVLKQSPTEFLKWKQEFLGLTDEGLAEVKSFKSGTYGEIEHHKNPDVMKVVNAITEMNFAEETLRRAKQNGVEGAAGTEFSKYYIPMVHDFDQIRYMGRTIGMDNIADAYGTQLLRMMPSLKGKANLKRQLGMQFLAGIQGGKTGDKLLKRAAAQEFDGLGKEDIMILLRNVGMNDVEIAKGMENMFGKPTKDSVGKVTTALRNRNDWDLEEVFSTPDGLQFKLGDFLNTDLDANLAKYNLQMSSRTGLARVGIRSGAELQTLLDDVFEQTVTAGTAPEKARQVLDHLRDTVLGRPTGEPVAEWVRSLSTVGSALQLANSAIYNVAELALIQKEHGIKMMAKHFAATIRGSGIEKLTKADATTLQDIISGRIIAEGRMRPIVHHLDDNFEGAVGSMHETISWAGQSVRFLNGSEHMRRGMIAMNTAILEDRLLSALKGSTKDLKYFKSLGMSDELIDRVRKEVDANGTHMELWNSFTSDELTTYLISATDNTVMSIRRGERPMFMDSAVGKILFPYMSFVFASHNKVLRRTVKNDGYTGLAMLALYQTPLAVLAAATTNITAGREWDENIATGTLKAMSFAGMWSIPGDLVTRGQMGGVSPVFAPVNALANLSQEAFKDDPSVLNVVKNSYFASVNPVLRLMAAGVDN